MGRYSKTPIVKKYDKKENNANVVRRRYITTIYKTIPKSDGDIYIITTSGDRLDTLASQFYGDSRFWWYIAQANNLNSINIEDGTSLRIPPTIADISTQD